MPGGSIPGEVLEGLRSRRAIASAPPDWKVLSLSKSNPIFRVEAPEGSWILKRSRDPQRDMAAADLFKGFGIPAFSAEELGDGWLALEDLGLPTLGAFIRKAKPEGELFFRLGEAAIQAELLGMRDRKLANILVDAGGGGGGLRIILVDYEGAFQAGLFDRVFRPWLYCAYLLTRFFFDVVDGVPEGGFPGEEVELFLSRFREGMLSEQGRLNAMGRRIPPTRVPLTLRQRIVLWSRVRSGKRLSRLLEAAIPRASRKRKA